jgi:hypothetical protein
MASGDDMEAGRTNEADQITLIVGGKNEDGDEFGDEVVFLGSYDRDHSPDHAVDGIVGLGWSGTITSGVAPAFGRGVVGLGGPAAGTGVFGRGGYNKKTYPKSWGIVGGPLVEGSTTGGIGVHGAGGDATDFSFLGNVDPGSGVFGQGGKQHEFNTSRAGTGAGVLGVAGSAAAPAFAEMQSTGVFGQGADSETHNVVSNGVPGTAGPKEPGPGVVGRGGVQPATAASGGPPAAGVVGVPGGHNLPPFSMSASNGVFGLSLNGSGVAGESPRNGFGVSGRARGNHSVFGDNRDNAVTPLPGTLARTSGCYGRTLNNRGVSGVVGLEEWAKNKPETIDDFATGVFGQAGLFFDREQRLTSKGFAGVFLGPVVTWGPFVNIGGSPKSAAVPHPDGSHRLLYCVESPESWFEDFGEAKLVKGKASVKIDKDFAAVVNSAGYHVFLSAYGDSRGLYVSRRDRSGFEVREQQGGRSSLTFSYRIVARRKDVPAERLPKFDAASYIIKQVKKQKPERPRDTKKKK